MAPPWGPCWRKCPTRGYTRGSVDAPSTLRRGKANVSGGIQKNDATKTQMFHALGIDFGSIWPPFWLHFGMNCHVSFWICFQCVFFWLLRRLSSPQPSILALSPTRRAIVRVYAMSRQVPNKLQDMLKLNPKINQKSTSKPSTNQSKNASDVW